LFINCLIGKLILVIDIGLFVCQEIYSSFCFSIFLIKLIWKSTLKFLTLFSKFLPFSQIFSLFLKFSHFFSNFLTFSQNFSLFLKISHFFSQNFSLFLKISHFFSKFLTFSQNFCLFYQNFSLFVKFSLVNFHMTHNHNAYNL